MVSCINPPRLPVIDLSLFDLGDPWRDQVAAQIDAASSEFGLFYLVGHGIEVAVVEPLMEAGRRFFAAEDAAKRRVQMANDERARHGDFAPAKKLTADSLDLTGGLYFEAQFTADDARTGAARAAHGQIFSPDVPGSHEPVLDYMRSLTGLGHKLMALVARGLRLQDSFFVDRYTGNPATSFRIFNYPQDARAADDKWSAGAHTDPGLLTILKQDGNGGLELQYRNRWIEVPDLPNSFICSIGHALARLTNARYAAAAHRVRNSIHGDRLSMSFGFEATLDTVLEPIAAVGPAGARALLATDGANALLMSAHRQRA